MAQESAEDKLKKMMSKSEASSTPEKTAAAPSSAVTTKKKFSFAFSMQALNQILLLGVVLCVLGLVFEINKGMALIGKGVNLTDDTKGPVAIAEIALPSAKDAKFYVDHVSARNIFRPYEAAVKAPAGAQGLAKRLSKYKLVGIAWLDLPESAAIMVEDNTDKTTHFLKQGEQLEGVTVKTIYTDRAVFSYENEETTIKL